MNSTRLYMISTFRLLVYIVIVEAFSNSGRLAGKLLMILVLMYK